MSLQPKSFQKILAEMERAMFDNVNIKDLNSGSVMSGLLEQIAGTPHTKLARFLYKLDPVRFKEAKTYVWDPLSSAGIIPISGWNNE